MAYKQANKVTAKPAFREDVAEHRDRDLKTLA